MQKIWQKEWFGIGFKEFMLTDLITGRHDWKFQQHVKEIIKTVLYKLRLSKRQFWGYIRSLEEHLQFLKTSGFSKFEAGRHDNISSYWIKAIR